MRGCIGLVVTVVSACVAAPACSDPEYRCPASQGPNLVTMCLGTPTFVAYRDGNGEWLTPSDAAKEDHYNLCVTDDYVVVAAYERRDGSYQTYEFATTVAEPNLTDSWCRVGDDWDRRDVEVAGEMTQPGAVHMDGVGHFGQSGPWSYSFEVGAGVHDLIAVSADDRILITRDIAIDSKTMLPRVDMDAGGQPLTAVDLSIEGLVPGDAVSTSVTLWTGTNDVAEISESQTSTAKVAPAEVLRKTDDQWLDAYARDGSFGRGASVKFTGTETAFSLAPQLGGVVTYDSSVPAASWTSLPMPTYTTVRLSTQGNRVDGTFGSFELVEASRGWLDINASLSIGFDKTAPGYVSAWNIDRARQYRWRLSVYEVSSTVSYWSSVGEDVNGTSPRLSPEADTAAFARPAREQVSASIEHEASK